MPTNEIGEKIYYNDNAAKVTNVRVTCEHITVPVGKIGSVDLNLKVEGFAFGIFMFFLSLVPFLFYGLLPESLKAVFTIISLVLLAASASWTFFIYRNYVELCATIGGRKVVLLTVSMGRKDYLSRIASAIGDAMADEDRYRNMRASASPETMDKAMDMSETMRLKYLLDDYQRLKEMKELILKNSAANA